MNSSEHKTGFTTSERKSQRRISAIKEQLRNKTLSPARRLKLQNERVDIENTMRIILAGRKKNYDAVVKKMKDDHPRRGAGGARCKICHDEGHPTNHSGAHFKNHGMTDDTVVYVHRFEMGDEVYHSERHIIEVFKRAFRGEGDRLQAFETELRR